MGVENQRDLQTSYHDTLMTCCSTVFGSEVSEGYPARRRLWCCGLCPIYTDEPEELNFPDEVTQESIERHIVDYTKRQVSDNRKQEGICCMGCTMFAWCYEWIVCTFCCCCHCCGNCKSTKEVIDRAIDYNKVTNPDADIIFDPNDGFWVCCPERKFCCCKKESSPTD